MFFGTPGNKAECFSVRWAIERYRENSFKSFGGGMRDIRPSTSYKTALDLIQNRSRPILSELDRKTRAALRLAVGEIVMIMFFTPCSCSLLLLQQE